MPRSVPRAVYNRQFGFTDGDRVAIFKPAVGGKAFGMGKAEALTLRR